MQRCETQTVERWRSSAVRSSCFAEPSALAVAARHEAAIAEPRPRRRLGVADATAADRRIVDLRTQLLHHASRGRLLERRSLFDRDAGDAGILQREPAEVRRLARRLFRLREARAMQ